MMNIGQDRNRFEQIVKSSVRKNLHKYIIQDDFVGKRGDHVVRIPIRHIDIPHFVYDKRLAGGVGQGDGDIGDAVGDGADDEVFGSAGEEPGKHELDIEMTPDRLTDLLIEFLQLPLLEPKGKRMTQSEKRPLKSIGRTGNKVKFKRTYINALRRQMANKTYDPDHPVVISSKEDFLYMIPKRTLKEETNAVIVYMMDVSGSMRSEQQRLCRITNYWLERIIKKRYQHVEQRYIIHDSVAKEVDSEEFYKTRGDGGTKFSPAYLKFRELVTQHYPPSEWNIYPFHYSDGDNSSGDNATALSLLEKEVLPVSNMFCYGQCANSVPGPGKFIEIIVDHFKLDDEKLPDPKARVRVAKLYDDTQIIPAIGKFLK
ncbi:DUF444 family protein [Candidatus Woesearchaeota archaeon]|nr:DUF444 family protein [Candidatus Woesearchaeota archaeon]